MTLFYVLLGLAILAPVVPLLVARLNRPAGGPVPERGQAIRRASIAGAVGILPAGLLFMLGAYGDWIVLLVIALIGALYGGLVGAAVVGRRFF